MIANGDTVITNTPIYMHRPPNKADDVYAPGREGQGAEHGQGRAEPNLNTAQLSILSNHFGLCTDICTWGNCHPPIYRSSATSTKKND